MFIVWQTAKCTETVGLSGRELSDFCSNFGSSFSIQSTHQQYLLKAFVFLWWGSGPSSGCLKTSLPLKISLLILHSLLCSKWLAGIKHCLQERLSPLIQQIRIATKKQEAPTVIQLQYMKFPLMFFTSAFEMVAGRLLLILCHPLLLWSVEAMF